MSDKTQLSVLAMELSLEEKAFCEALVSNPGITGKDAAIKAGWSPRSAHVLASRALDRPRVQAYLQALKYTIDNPGERKIQRKVMKAREVLWRLSRIGRASMKPHLDLNTEGEVVGTKIDFEHADTIRELTFTRKSGGEGDHAWSEDTVRAKVADPMPALQALQKYHGLEKTPPQGPSQIINILAMLPEEELKRIWLAEREKRALTEGGE